MIREDKADIQGAGILQRPKPREEQPFTIFMAVGRHRQGLGQENDR